ncbi:hypothetical protein V1479_06785 [Mesorhizobium sediminum]|uniref:DUF4169 domain-containing protein n=1 Tax=Neoaquamicrobium sediminum TaxID=1849104 RepID=A0ABV3WS15_9HYPH
MPSPTDSASKQTEEQDRKAARLAQKLRANLQRRKAQARSRGEGGADSRPEGLLKGEGDDSE